jgi:hypothetical protein
MASHTCGLPWRNGVVRFWSGIGMKRPWRPEWWCSLGRHNLECFEAVCRACGVPTYYVRSKSMHSRGKLKRKLIFVTLADADFRVWVGCGLGVVR